VLTRANTTDFDLDIMPVAVFARTTSMLARNRAPALPRPAMTEHRDYGCPWCC
jgi:hypothetical protein